MRGISGWLLVYAIGSVPPMAVYSMGLSGWFLDGQPPLGGEQLQVAILTLAGIVSFSLIWAAVWTKYFRESERVRNTFPMRFRPTR